MAMYYSECYEITDGSITSAEMATLIVCAARLHGTLVHSKVSGIGPGLHNV